VRKKLFPRRCDLSADGKLFLYYLSGGIDGRYRVFGGISRTSWLHPLASWDEHDTWGRGSCFVTASTLHTWGETRDVDLSTTRVTVQKNDVVSFVNERRRGWAEAPDCPPRGVDDHWDEKRSVILEKESPSHAGVLRLVGGPYQPEGGMDGRAPAFEIQLRPGGRRKLGDVAWADWDHRGRLLVATKDGFLRAESIEGGEQTVVEEHDLSNLTPNPQAAPEWASSAPSGPPRTLL